MEVLSLKKESSSLLRDMGIAILMTDGVEEVEYLHPRSFFERHGASVVTLAPKLESESVQTYRMGQPTGEYRVDLDLRHAQPSEFNALVVPGGVSSPVTLYLTNTAVTFIRSFARLSRPIAAICHGPAILIPPGLVAGRRVTSWPSLRPALEDAGAEWVDLPVVIDGNLLTARGPKELTEFPAASRSPFVKSSPHSTLKLCAGRVLTNTVPPVFGVTAFG